MSTPFANAIELAREKQTDNGKPWSLFAFHGWISLHQVILKTGDYFLQIYRLLVLLEEMVAPRPAGTEGSLLGVGLGIGGNLVPAMRDPIIGDIQKHVDEIAKASAEMGLSRTSARLGWLRAYINQNQARFTTTLDMRGDAKMQSELRVLYEALLDDLQERLVFFPEMGKVDEYMRDAAKHLDEAMANAFPGIERDFAGATRAYIYDDYTASVFYSMRVAEYGLRGLAHKILGHKRKQLDSLQWGPIVRDLGAKIEAMHQAKKKPSLNRKKLLDFYSDARAQCVYFKSIRDDTMHSRGYYESADALKALSHTEDFIRLLTKHGIKLPPMLPSA